MCGNDVTTLKGFSRKLWNVGTVWLLGTLGLDKKRGKKGCSFGFQNAVECFILQRKKTQGVFFCLIFYATAHGTESKWQTR